MFVVSLLFVVFCFGVLFIYFVFSVVEKDVHTEVLLLLFCRCFVVVLLFCLIFGILDVLVCWWLKVTSNV